jgi:hypothetical protein
MLLTTAAGVTILLLAYTFVIRRKDLPEAVAASPWQHLDSRKAAIYENLRDLQFEYRVGKLSDADYQRTKTELQAELAGVLAEIDKMKANTTPTVKSAVVKSKPAASTNICPHCNAKFPQPLKFCGECGKPMGAQA